VEISDDRQRNVPAADSSSGSGDRNDEVAPPNAADDSDESATERTVRTLISRNRDAFVAALSNRPPEVGRVVQTRIAENEATERAQLEAETAQAASARNHEVALQEREAWLTVYQDRYKLESRMTWARMLIAAALVLAVILAVFYGLIRGIKPGDYAQYIAPISALAGLAVGYFFGRSTTTEEPKPPSSTAPSGPLTRAVLAESPHDPP
jgi:hypothetical protein